MAGGLRAQDLTFHQWRDRVLLLFTDDLQNPDYIRQTDALKKQRGELKERKLVVYTLLKDRHAEGLPPGRWESGISHGIGKKVPENGFRLALIGLDGRIKLEEPGYVPPGALWMLIDGMPMRRAELENKGNP